MTNKSISTKNNPRPQLTAYKRILAIRDGKECFYCGANKPKDQLTIEHMLAVLDGGTHHIKNLALACYECNNDAGRMSIVDKVKLRDKKRSNNHEGTTSQ